MCRIWKLDGPVVSDAISAPAAFAPTPPPPPPPPKAVLLLLLLLSS